MRVLVLMVLTMLALAFTACENPNALVDEQKAIEHSNWTYVNPVRVKVQVDDPTVSYHLLIKLRHTADYRYSNIFLRIRQVHPNKKVEQFRKEYVLANPDGEWLGTGSGNLYSYRLPLYLNYRFPAKGSYVFEIEQNMRDNPLREISDVGLRVEKAAQ